MSAHDRSSVLEQLRQIGVETVTASYNGEGDDGQIDDLDFGAVEVSDAVMRATEDLFYNLLCEWYGGWQDNTGSFGQLVWNLRDDRVDLVHNARYEAYDTEERFL